MTTACFFYSGEQCRGFSVEGHSGLAEAGQDVLCAGISSAVRLVECTLNDVLKVQARVEVEEAFVSVRLDSLEAKVEEMAVSCLTGLELYFTQLVSEYPDYFQIMTKQ